MYKKALINNKTFSFNSLKELIKCGSSNIHCLLRDMESMHNENRVIVKSGKYSFYDVEAVLIIPSLNAKQIGLTIEKIPEGYTRKSERLQTYAEIMVNETSVVDVQLYKLYGCGYQYELDIEFVQ